METTAILTKHKRTLAPWQCAHCKTYWYGIASGGGENIPPDVHLCFTCWGAFDRWLYENHRELYAMHRNEKPIHVYPVAMEWIADEKQEPLPREGEKQFDRSVPRFMRLAIVHGLVTPNGNDCYTVYTGSGGTLINVEKNRKQY